MPKLTKLAVDKAQVTDKDYVIWCEELPSFGVRIQPSGSKTYMIRYRAHDGKQRKMKIGRACEMPPEKARDLARKAFIAVAEGRDPTMRKREDKASPTMADLAERHLREWATPFKKPSSRKLDEENWSRYILPAMGTKKVKDITKADVLSLYGAMSNTPAVAIQCLALLSKAFSLAEDWEWREKNANPCYKIKRYKLRVRQTVLKPEQIAKLDATLTSMEQSAEITPAFSRFIRLLQVTGCRKMEILGAKREWVDFEQGILHLPDSKVGERFIKLPAVAVDLLRKEQGEWLIPGERSKRHLDNVYKIWKKVKKEAGLPEDFRFHDLRHSMGSLAHREGLSQKQVASLLGHKQIATTARYLHDIESDTATNADIAASVITRQWASHTA